jgi:hypothetical protein
MFGIVQFLLLTHLRVVAVCVTSAGELTRRAGPALGRLSSVRSSALAGTCRNSSNRLGGAAAHRVAWYCLHSLVSTKLRRHKLQSQADLHRSRRRKTGGHNAPPDRFPLKFALNERTHFGVSMSQTPTVQSQPRDTIRVPSALTIDDITESSYPCNCWRWQPRGATFTPPSRVSHIVFRSDGRA